MMPVFGEETRVVVVPIAFEDLAPEMMVAYRDRQGNLVVHQLHSRQGNRWTAVGINNPNLDPEPVTRDNLVGVVYAFFHADSPNPNPE